MACLMTEAKIKTRDVLMLSLLTTILGQLSALQFGVASTEASVKDLKYGHEQIQGGTTCTSK